MRRYPIDTPRMLDGNGGTRMNSTPPRKKLIEVALPLDAINIAGAHETSICHGHPSMLHLW